MSPQAITSPSVEVLNHPITDVPQFLIDVTNRSIVQTFEKMFGATSVESPEIESSEVEGVVGLISFVGDVTWSLAMMFPQKAAVDLAYKFASFEIEYEGPDMGDVVGEIVNVLAGVICGELGNQGIHSQMSLPTVTRGKHVELLLGGHLIAKRLIVSVADNQFGIRLIVSKTTMIAPVIF